MIDLNELFYFVKIVEAGGFAAAERALCIPKSKLSRRTARLEERLGVRLIHRSTRHFVLTEVGQTYFEHCKAMLVEADAAQDAIDTLSSEPRGTIKFSCPTGLLHFHVSTMLADFMLKYPQIKIQLEATNRPVDVVAEGFDLAIRVRPAPLQDSDLALRILSDRGQCLVASPALVAQMGLPKTPADLAHWPSLSRSRPKERTIWTLESVDGTQVQVEHQPKLITTEMVALLSAALNGVGVVQLPVLMVQQYLRSGQLVSVIPGWAPQREIIHLVFPSRRGLLPSVRAFIDHLAESYSAFNEE
jgi:DNA-binding transcriptional LysR family regulator